MTISDSRYRLLAWLALIVWVATLFMPLQSGELADNRLAIGLFALLFGWSVHPAWLANLGFVLVLCWLFRKAEPPRRPATVVSVLTAGLALSALTWNNAIDEFQKAQQFAVDFGLGFYAWVGTICVASAALAARARRK